ncbi:Hypothetical protein Ldb1988 [Lactobacillus delbrueckii subsp. bulgaricus ATCC 11842 = JCM 1002]|uniref:Uncharacterized protein n=1 Tax=Lactobacillus delbrueckii subsp. bulgaricus (strain ATCC 11842 / DSM 20081 / BCRC 10696 / JCM 1002 / NBRC 13953 / NCIMB 11778 / NCTC 12712 / WDCM 00102 / Lb 14) TaxID=390333 RepID=Q1G8F8_LACDA|nr:Hypothetical protein Ldb1988 [Lactobacillus delbrueckii subsp. bulgaricus ATCC 11842 = JCM 1002]
MIEHLIVSLELLKGRFKFKNRPTRNRFMRSKGVELPLYSDNNSELMFEVVGRFLSHD